MYIQLNGQILYYEKYGEGQPFLLVEMAKPTKFLMYWFRSLLNITPFMPSIPEVTVFLLLQKNFITWIWQTTWQLLLMP